MLRDLSDVDSRGLPICRSRQFVRKHLCARPCSCVRFKNTCLVSLDVPAERYPQRLATFGVQKATVAVCQIRRHRWKVTRDIRRILDPALPIRPRQEYLLIRSGLSFCTIHDESWVNGRQVRAGGFACYISFWVFPHCICAHPPYGTQSYVLRAAERTRTTLRLRHKPKGPVSFFFNPGRVCRHPWTSGAKGSLGQGQGSALGCVAGGGVYAHQSFQFALASKQLNGGTDAREVRRCTIVCVPSIGTLPASCPSSPNGSAAVLFFTFFSYSRSLSEW